MNDKEGPPKQDERVTGVTEQDGVVTVHIGSRESEKHAKVDSIALKLPKDPGAGKFIELSQLPEKD